MISILVITVTLCLFAIPSEQCSPATLPPGGTWVSSPNCSGVMFQGNLKCHCWGHCGYICTPIATTKTTTTTTTTTTTSTAAPGTCKPQYENGPPQGLGPGETWLAIPGCPLGGGPPGAIITGTEFGRCRCYAFCGYICGEELQ